jgi:hypothetical protein
MCSTYNGSSEKHRIKPVSAFLPSSPVEEQTGDENGGHTVPVAASRYSTCIPQVADRTSLIFGKGIPHINQKVETYSPHLVSN